MIKIVRISMMITLSLCFEKMPFWFMPIPLVDAADMTVQKHTDVIPDAQSAKELSQKTAKAKSVVDAKNDEIIGIVGPPLSKEVTVVLDPPVSFEDPRPIAVIDPPAKDHSKGLVSGVRFPTYRYHYLSGQNEQVSMSSSDNVLTISWGPVWEPVLKEDGPLIKPRIPAVENITQPDLVKLPPQPHIDISTVYSLNLETMTIGHSQCFGACSHQEITLKDNKTEFLKALKVMEEKVKEGLKAAPKGATKVMLRVTSSKLALLIRKVERARAPSPDKPIGPQEPVLIW